MKKHVGIGAALGAIALASAAALATGCTPAAPDEAVGANRAPLAGASWAYGYTSDGEVASVSGPGGTRTTTTTASAITSGASSYALDALARVTARDGARFAYGPDGALASASVGAHRIAYVTDEHGERIAKRRDGAWTAAWVDGVVLSGNDVVESVRVAGKVVGVVKNGAFASVASDARGTVLAGTDGVTTLPSPYGERAAHPDVASAIDYAEKEWDADVAVVRMGVRDYDPYLGRFLQPDPLFLADPSRCVARPHECNLFGYAAGDPLGLFDPDGTETRLVATIDPKNLRGTMKLVDEHGSVLWESHVTNRTSATKAYGDHLPPPSQISPRREGSSMPLAAGTYPIGSSINYGTSHQFPTGSLEVHLADGSDQGIRIHNDYQQGHIPKSVVDAVQAGERPDWNIGTKGCFRTEQAKQAELVKIAKDEMPTSLTLIYQSPGSSTSPAPSTASPPAESSASAPTSNAESSTKETSR